MDGHVDTNGNIHVELSPQNVRDLYAALDFPTSHNTFTLSKLLNNGTWVHVAIPIKPTT